MRAVVVYESMYGNTRRVAEHIAAGLSSAAVDVQALPVSRATPQALEGADLVVIGGATHAHAMSRPSTRRSAVEQADSRGLLVEEDAGAPGLREWFAAMPRLPRVAAAAFDTRLDAPKLVSGQAARGIAVRLRRHGHRLVAEPQSFLVDKHTVLLAGELARAATWGRRLSELNLVAQ